MTTEANQTTQPVKPKMSITKKIFIVIGFILAMFGVDHFTYNLAGIGADVTVTDSTIVVAPSPDTTVEVAPVVAIDTTKKDTAK